MLLPPTNEVWDKEMFLHMSGGGLRAGLGVRIQGERSLHAEGRGSAYREWANPHATGTFNIWYVYL